MKHFQFGSGIAAVCFPVGLVWQMFSFCFCGSSGRVYRFDSYFCGENVLTRYSSSGSGKVQQKALLYTAAEHHIKRESVDQNALDIIQKLNSWGYKAFIVGGAVRDMLIGHTPKDFDIVTDAVPAKIKKIFRNSRIIGRRFRLVHVFFGPIIYEVSTFRSLVDGTVGNTYGTMDEDVHRRDFTLNALYYDPIKEIVIDYVNGVTDIRKGIVRPVIPLKHIFTEDPVRMLRAIKYAAMSQFSLSFLLACQIRRQSALLAPVSPSRLTEEIIKILNSGHAADIVAAAIKYELFMYLQPAAASLMDGSAVFARNYMASLHKLDNYLAVSSDVRMGKKLSFMLDSFVALLLEKNNNSADMPKDIGALYQYMYRECRQFVLPMNPPRYELDFAVRFCMRNCGINIRFSRAAPAETTSRRRHSANPKIESTVANADFTPAVCSSAVSGSFAV